MPATRPHWRRGVTGTDHGRTWAGVGLGALVMFLALELPALGGKAGDTLSEAVWSVTRPFEAGWWLAMPSFWGLCAWLCAHFAFRWGGALALLWCVIGAYAVALTLYLILKGP